MQNLGLYLLYTQIVLIPGTFQPMHSIVIIYFCMEFVVDPVSGENSV